MKRVFAAIDISDEARVSIGEYVKELRSEFERIPVRWERPEKMHLTVKFAGSLDEEQLAIFTERVTGAAKSVDPFRIRICGTGAFIKRRGPSVLWLGIEVLLPDSNPFQKIAAMLDGDQLRPFRPHITIARLKDAKKAQALIGRHKAVIFQSPEFEVNEIVIYESMLLPTGSVYTKVAGFALRVV